MRRFIPVIDRGRVDNVLYWAGIGFASAPLSPDELERQIMRAAEDPAGVVFPSHLFEYEHWRLALELTRRHGIRAATQISPGAELEEFFGILRDETLSLSLELILDRPLHAADIARLERLAGMGRESRFVICPTREFDGLKTYLSLPTEKRAEARFYFPPKRTAGDRFLDSDEIYILTRRLSEAGAGAPLPIAEYLHRHEPPSGAETAETRAFRKSPNQISYQDGFVQLGESKAFRKLLKTLSMNRRLSWLGLALYALVHFTVDPLDAAHGIGTRAYWRLYSTSTTANGWLRWARGLLHALVTRLLWRAYALIHLALGILRHPVWTIQNHVPPLYWVFVFPLQKAGWFASYQFSKRILRR